MGYQVFPSKNFCLAVQKIFVGEPFGVSLISGIENFWIRRGGISIFFVENYLSQGAERFRRGTLLCFTNFGYRKTL